jgi:mannose-6-phosphate isomerase-like protein (cupin superfamily)
MSKRGRHVRRPGPRIVNAGESIVIPAGVIHDAHNHGSAPSKLVGVYVVEKGKPLATPAS